MPIHVEDRSGQVFDRLEALVETLGGLLTEIRKKTFSSTSLPGSLPGDGRTAVSAGVTPGRSSSRQPTRRPSSTRGLRDDRFLAADPRHGLAYTCQSMSRIEAARYSTVSKPWLKRLEVFLRKSVRRPSLPLPCPVLFQETAGPPCRRG